MIKKIKFKESKLPIVEVSFWLVILFSFISIFLVFKNYIYDFEVKGFDYPLETIKINYEYDSQLNTPDTLFCFNNFCKNPDESIFGNNYKVKFSHSDANFIKEKTNRIIFAYPVRYKNLEDKIRNFDIHTGVKNYYYTNKDIKNFKKNTIQIQLNNEEKKEYNILIFPPVDNYRGIKYHIFISFLSLFYDCYIFLLPYFWLFCAYLIYVHNKEKFKFNFKLTNKCAYIILFLIILTGLCIRLTDITYYPLWTDEVYTKTVALNNFKSCFQDPGNPPLFFIVDYLFTKVFSNNSDFILRLPALIFGVLSIPASFLLFKKFSLKLALFASFMVCINTVNIYHSQEARGYTLSMLLIILTIYTLFEYLKNPNNKNLIFYILMSIFCINQNYYLVLFAFTNYIWGVFDLIQNKNKNQILKFSLANLFAFLTFIPYFIISSKNAFNPLFNAWIPVLSYDTFKYIIKTYFLNKYVFIFLCLILLFTLIICYLPKNKIEKYNLKINLEKEDLFIYLIYTITFILILASGISVFIKPILHKRTLLSVYGLLLMLEILMISGIFDFKKYSKLMQSIKTGYSLILMLICFLVTMPIAVRNFCNVSDFMNFIVNDSKLYPSDYEIIALTSDTKDYLKHYPKTAEIKRIKWYFLNTNNGLVLHSIKKSDYTNKNKKVVIYFNSIGVDTSSFAFMNPNVYMYWSNLTPIGKIVYK